MKQLQAVVENRTGFCLDPRTKLLLMAVVATAEFLYSHTAFMIAVAMIPFVLLLTNRQYKTATVFFCLFATGLFVQAIQNYRGLAQAFRPAIKYQRVPVLL